MTDGLGTRLFRYDRTGSMLAKYFPAAAAAAFFTGIVFLYKRSKYFAAIIIGILIFNLYISITSYGAVYPYRSYILLLALISLFWAEKNKYDTERKIENCAGREYKLFKAIEYLTALIMLLTVPTGIEISAEDWKMNFSSGMETADFIKKNIPADDRNVIISTMLPAAFYLDDRTVYYEYEKPLITILKKKEADINLTAFANRYDNIYLVLSGLQKHLLHNQILLYEAPQTMSPAERLYVYKLRKININEYGN